MSANVWGPWDKHICCACPLKPCSYHSWHIGHKIRESWPLFRLLVIAASSPKANSVVLKSAVDLQPCIKWCCYQAVQDLDLILCPDKDKTKPAGRYCRQRNAERAGDDQNKKFSSYCTHKSVSEPWNQWLTDDLNFPCPPSHQNIQKWRQQTVEYINSINNSHFQALSILEKASLEQSRSQKQFWGYFIRKGILRSIKLIAHMLSF